MGGPHNKSDANTGDEKQSSRQNQSQEQSQSNASGKLQRDTNVERANVENGGGNGVNEANTGTRRAGEVAVTLDVPPLYRHHPPPAQQSSAYIRRHI